MKVRSPRGTVSSGVHAIVLRIAFTKKICRYLDGIPNKTSSSYLDFLVTCNISASVMHASGIYRKLISDTTALPMVNCLPTI